VLQPIGVSKSIAQFNTFYNLGLLNKVLVSSSLFLYCWGCCLPLFSTKEYTDNRPFFINTWKNFQTCLWMVTKWHSSVGSMLAYGSKGPRFKSQRLLYVKIEFELKCHRLVKWFVVCCGSTSKCIHWWQQITMKHAVLESKWTLRYSYIPDKQSRVIGAINCCHGHSTVSGYSPWCCGYIPGLSGL
jgi:hypothetical protein